MSQKPNFFLQNLRIRTVKLLWKCIVGCRKLFVGCRLTKKFKFDKRNSNYFFLPIGLELPPISQKPALFLLQNYRIITLKLLWKRIVRCRKLFVGCRMTKKWNSRNKLKLFFLLLGLELPQCPKSLPFYII